MTDQLHVVQERDEGTKNIERLEIGTYNRANETTLLQYNRKQSKHWKHLYIEYKHAFKR